MQDLMPACSTMPLSHCQALALAGTASVGLTGTPQHLQPPTVKVYTWVLPLSSGKHPETRQEGGSEPPCAPAQGWGVCQGVPKAVQEGLEAVPVANCE